MRIQILELPTVVKGDDVETPFVVVLDDLTLAERPDQDKREEIAEATGAVGVIPFVTAVEIVR